MSVTRKGQISRKKFWQEMIHPLLDNDNDNEKVAGIWDGYMRMVGAGGLELDGEQEAKEASIAVECNNVHQVGDVVGRMIIIGGYHTPSSVGITSWQRRPKRRKNNS